MRKTAIYEFILANGDRGDSVKWVRCSLPATAFGHAMSEGWEWERFNVLKDDAGLHPCLDADYGSTI